MLSIVMKMKTDHENEKDGQIRKFMFAKLIQITKGAVTIHN